MLRHCVLLAGIVLAVVLPCTGGTVIFYEKDFPPADNGPISRAALEHAFSSLNPRFLGLADLQKAGALAEGDLLVLPYGSAFPADAWETIRRFVDGGNLLILGGRPFSVPVYHDSGGWRADPASNTFARTIGIVHSYEAPGHGPWTLRWDEDAPFFRGGAINARRVFVNAGHGGRYRGLGFFVDERGNRIAAPVVAEDLVGHGAVPHRRVYLSFDADHAYWESADGTSLTRRAARYAMCGGIRLWLNLEHLTLDPGEPVTGAVDVMRGGGSSTLKIELMSGSKVIASNTLDCDSTMHEEFNLPLPSNAAGLITVRATLSAGDTLLERYTTGVFVSDPSLLRSGARLGAGRDYFRLNDRPYLMVGANYFSTDPYTSGFFVGGSIGGNAWVWNRDFAEMERLGLSAVRTGIWLNRARYLDAVSGAADERVLRAIEAYLCAAARHRMQVIFTLFAFDPQVEMEAGPGQEGDRLGSGSNPYLDPVAIEAECAYVRAIASRFRSVPFLSYDLINEPSVTNPKRLWKGNSPNGDPKELAAWQQWLEKRYGRVDRLARAWHTTSGELGAFDRVPLPSFADLEPSRSGNTKSVRALDYNLFAQNAFCRWVDAVIGAIRSVGATQAVTVGQDEGGVTDRVLNQFWAETGVSYTVNHSWWRDDALLWNSVAAKSPEKPNLIGETGPQPVWGMDGSRRWDDVGGLGLEERKLVLGFAGANTGVLHWDWTRDDTYGLMRRDGSYKLWMDALAGIARFAHDAQPFALETLPPDIAIVLPQSVQLSPLGGWGLAAQQNAVRALYNFARGNAVATGEYQLSRMPPAKLIIVPSPMVISQLAWDQLTAKVRGGATLLISGRIDADEHWIPVPERTRPWNVEYSPGPLVTREVDLKWPGGKSHLTYSGDRTTYGERGFLAGEDTYAEVPFGAGRILYFALPLELADQVREVGRIYRFAMERAGVAVPYETRCEDPGILICPTALRDATLYVLTSESTGRDPVTFHDRLSGADIRLLLPPGRGALLLVRRDGETVASYNVH